MSDNKPAEESDVTKDWRASQGQESSAKRLRIFAALAWLVAIGGEVARRTSPPAMRRRDAARSPAPGCPPINAIAGLAAWPAIASGNSRPVTVRTQDEVNRAMGGASLTPMLCDLLELCPFVSITVSVTV